ncbi:hypothetical protein KIN20_023804 [Parelaphostrongylus tenuis]|uniref:Uncharacterized protein n=1 Tax=Parelaphostrongylus tenuis TaxID=148309 RepID=A0AAD5QT68_PARTN|nr:hypothetical protein KIN20_023804 [Parelaphostrongylus tenuis]
MKPYQPRYPVQQSDLKQPGQPRATRVFGTSDTSTTPNPTIQSAVSDDDDDEDEDDHEEGVEDDDDEDHHEEEENDNDDYGDDKMIMKMTM